MAEQVRVKNMSVQMPEGATAMKVGQFKQIMYIDKNTGAEVVELCTIDTGELVARKERKRTVYGADLPWELTYGQPIQEKKEVETMELAPSKNPIFFRQDTPTEWCWRIRQIPYPANFYQVTVDEAKNQIVVRTTNKKYFKRIDAPNGEKMLSSEINWNWQYETLVITHKKPPRVISFEKQLRDWRKSLKMNDGEPDCQTQ